MIFDFYLVCCNKENNKDVYCGEDDPILYKKEIIDFNLRELWVLFQHFGIDLEDLKVKRGISIVQECLSSGRIKLEDCQGEFENIDKACCKKEVVSVVLQVILKTNLDFWIINAIYIFLLKGLKRYKHLKIVIPKDLFDKIKNTDDGKFLQNKNFKIKPENLNLINISNIEFNHEELRNLIRIFLKDVNIEFNSQPNC